MTIRARLSIWYAVVLFLALLLIGRATYHEVYKRARLEPASNPKYASPQRFALDETAEMLLRAGLPAALLGLAGGWWLTRRALAPLAALTDAAERLTERNLGEQLPRTGNRDELDRLTEVLNAMTARLNDSFSRTRDFTLHASHELKTPLTILRGEAEMAVRDRSLPFAERERWANQLDELRRLSHIVDALTLLTKADAGQVKLTLEPVQLEELVQDNLADARILAEPQGIQVELSACEECVVRADRHRLRQLLLNLADNAVKYNQPNGKIIMALKRAGANAELTISNTGPGIAPEILSRVFDRFFRGDPAHSSAAVEGCGLGLTIARWIATAHHGSISIQSLPASLTTVNLTLPLLKPASKTDL
jgi:signal transduction histidine kinase